MDVQARAVELGELGAELELDVGDGEARDRAIVSRGLFLARHGGGRVRSVGEDVGEQAVERARLGIRILKRRRVALDPAARA